jgi:purine-binding chemotaxis protein CheW
MSVNESATLGGEVTNFKRKRLGLQDDIEPSADYLTINLADQIFGIPVLQIQDVLGGMQVTQVPLAPPEVSGALNLRGRIVTAINVRKSLGLEPYDGEKDPLSVVVEHKNELYSLIIDAVNDVFSIDDKDIETAPPTLDNLWRDIAMGIYRMDSKLMIILDVPKLLAAIH